MAKIQELTETTTPTDVAVLPVVLDPAGTPLDRKVTVANLRGTQGRQIFAMATDRVFSDLADVELLEGTFTALTATYDFHVDIDCLVAGPARTIFYLYVGQPGTPGTPLYDVSGAAANGGTSYVIGNINVDTVGGHCGRTIPISGLTPGGTVTFQILPGIIGSAYVFKCIDGPNSMAITPDGKWLFVSKQNSASIQPWRINPNGYAYEYDMAFREQPGVSIRSTITPWKFALANDLGIVGSTFTAVLSIFAIGQTPTNGVGQTPGEWLRDATLPAGNPYGVTMNPTLAGLAPTTAYTCNTAGNMYPITLATGVVGTAVAVGVGTDVLYDLCMNKAGTKVYVCNFTQNRVNPVTLPSTVGGNIAMVGKPVRIRRPPSMAVTGAAATDVLTAAQDHCLDVDEKVVFTDLTGGTGLTAGTNYFVISDGLGPLTFKVSATLGGAAVNFTTDVTAGTVTRNKMWVLTEAGGTGTVAMLKSIDLDTDTVTATYELDYTNGKDFDIMQAGRVAYVTFAAGKFQQMNLEGQFAGSRPASHTGNLAQLNGATFTGTVSGCAIDKLDSIYYAMFEADELFKHPGCRTYFLQAGFYGSHCAVVAEAVR